MSTDAVQNDYRVLREPVQREILKDRAVDFIYQAGTMDTIVFLDKSARPLSQFLYDLWPKFYSNRPLPRVLNIDIGNEKGVVLSDHAFTTWKRHALIENLVPELDSEAKIREIYGSVNIDRLQSLLKSNTPEHRLIVDDLSQSGRTLIITKLLMMVLDPVNTYKYFTFIEKNDLEFFYKPRKGWITPWKQKESAGDIQDPKSFLVSDATDKQLNKLGQLRKELQMLAGEIKPT